MISELPSTDTIQFDPTHGVGSDWTYDLKDTPYLSVGGSSLRPTLKSRLRRLWRALTGHRDHQDFFQRDWATGQVMLERDGVPFLIKGNLNVGVMSAGDRFDGGVFTTFDTPIKVVDGPFQGSWLDPILPGDPRYVWTWGAVDWAASMYQTGDYDFMKGMVL